MQWWMKKINEQRQASESWIFIKPVLVFVKRLPVWKLWYKNMKNISSRSKIKEYLNNEVKNHRWAYSGKRLLLQKKNIRIWSTYIQSLLINFSLHLIPLTTEFHLIRRYFSFINFSKPKSQNFKKLKSPKRLLTSVYYCNPLQTSIN